MLQVWLPLNGNLDNQGLSDLNLRLINTGTWDNNGKIGKCYNGGGNGYVLCETPIALTNQFTISFWLKINSFNVAWARIFGFYKNADEYCGMCYSNTTSVGFHIYDSINNTKTKIVDVYRINQHNISVGEWEHITITFDGTYIKHYLNGQDIYTDVLAQDFKNDLYPQLGICANGNGGNKADCCVNDFRLYDECLSPLQIKEISKGLVLHYKLDRGGFGNDNLVKNTADQFSVPATNDYTVRYTSVSYPQNTSLTASDFLLQACEKKLTLSYDVYCPGVYRNTSQSMNRIGCYLSITIKNNTTGESKSFYGHHSLNGVATPYHTLDKINSLNDVSASATADNPDTSFIGHYSRTIQPKDDSRVAEFYNNPSNYTVTFTGIYADIKGYIKEESWIRNIKLEFGDNETEWTPNSADTLYTSMGLNDNVVYDVSGFRNNGELYTTDGTASFFYEANSPRYTMAINPHSSNSTANAKAGTAYIRGGCQLTNPTQLTIAFWCYARKQGYGTAITQGMFCTTNYPAGNDNIGVDFQNSAMNHRDGAVDVNNSAANQHIKLGITFIENEWHHYAFTYDGQYARSYRDGVQFGVTNFSSAETLGSFQNVILGFSKAGSVWRRNNNTYSDLRVYATALSADDILALYQVPISLSNNGTLFAGEFVEG